MFKLVIQSYFRQVVKALSKSLSILKSQRLNSYGLQTQHSTQLYQVQALKFQIVILAST